MLYRRTTITWNFRLSFCALSILQTGTNCTFLLGKNANLFPFISILRNWMVSDFLSREISDSAVLSGGWNNVHWLIVRYWKQKSYRVCAIKYNTDGFTGKWNIITIFVYGCITFRTKIVCLKLPIIIFFNNVLSYFLHFPTLCSQIQQLFQHIF